MAVSSYDNSFLNENDKKKISALTESYNKAIASGNQSLADSYHQQAESIRAGYEYSGGADGSTYTYLPKDTSGEQPYTPGALTGAQSQESYLNALYKAREDASLNALKSAYDQNVIDLEAAKAKLPQAYQAARDQTAGNAAVSQANFNEYAAASGLNSGAGGQAALAMNTQLQGNLAAINSQEANALNDLETQRLKLSTQYQNDIAGAILEGNLQKASALYGEAVRVDESMAAMSQARADEDYRAWSSNYQASQNRRALAQSQVDAILKAGGTPSADLLAAAGYDPSYISAMQAYYAPSYSGSYSGGGYSTGRASSSKMYQTWDRIFTDPSYTDLDVDATLNALKRNYTTGALTKAEYDNLVSRVGS